MARFLTRDQTTAPERGSRGLSGCVDNNNRMKKMVDVVVAAVCFICRAYFSTYSLFQWEKSVDYCNLQPRCASKTVCANGNLAKSVKPPTISWLGNCLCIWNTLALKIIFSTPVLFRLSIYASISQTFLLLPSTFAAKA